MSKPSHIDPSLLAVMQVQAELARTGVMNSMGQAIMSGKPEGAFHVALAGLSAAFQMSEMVLGQLTKMESEKARTGLIRIIDVASDPTKTKEDLARTVEEVIGPTRAALVTSADGTIYQTEVH